MQRVLITGGAGFLGSHLTLSFRLRGISVRILDIAEQPEWAKAPEVGYVRGDIRDRAALRLALGGVDAVVHAAFASPRLAPAVIRSVNIDGTREVCQQALASGVRRLVLISSNIVNRPARMHPIFRGAALNSMELYRRSRSGAEQVVRSVGVSGLRVGIIRPKTFIGPGRISAFNIIFDWIRQGKPVFLLGKACCRYQLLEISDMAEGVRLATSSDVEGVFSLGAHEFGTLREDLQALIDHARTGATLRLVPPKVARVALRAMELVGMVPPSELHYMSAWNMDSVVDTSLAVEELGWQPRWSNAGALVNAYDWYVHSLLTTGTAKSIHQLPGSHRKLRRLIETLLR